MAKTARIVLTVLLVCAVAAVAPGPVRADSAIEQRLRSQAKQAMSEFDQLEYERAKKLLLEAIVEAKRQRLQQSRVLADIYVNLGVVYFAGFEDVESARLAFLEALAIDPGVSIDRAYRTKAMAELLRESREETAQSPQEAAECASVRNLDHSPVAGAEPGVPARLEVLVAGRFGDVQVILRFRNPADEQFRALRMKRVGICKYEGAIPGDAVGGDAVHYYLEVQNRRERTVARSGSNRRPHVIAVNAPDDPGPAAIVRADRPSAAAARALFISFAAGSGAGYVNGKTEQTEVAIKCCLAADVVHIAPEIGIYLNPRTSLSAAARVGFPVLANRSGHSKIAAAGLLRLRYGLMPGPNGLHLSGLLGVGLMRHTIKLTDVTDDAGDVDTSASGPLLTGAGLGYVHSLSQTIRLLVEFNTIAGVPVAQIVGIEPNLAFQFDLNLGLVWDM
jgi:Tfp pilus assembly protein PilF